MGPARGALPLTEVRKLSEGLEKTRASMAKNGIGSGEELWDLINSSHRDKHVGRAHLNICSAIDN